MADDLRGFRLRELAPDDGPAIGRLFDASPDSGMIRFRPSFQVDPYVALTELWVVTDARGELLAGIGSTEVRRLSILHVERLPMSMRLLDAILQVIPRSRSMEMVRLGKMWFRPGAEAAARYLFESARWGARERGNVVIASYDERGPLDRIIRPPRWSPRTSFGLALRAPDEIRPDHPIEPVQ